LAKGEKPLSRARRISVSKLTFLVWDLIALFWFLIWMDNINKHFHVYSIFNNCNSIQSILANNKAYFLNLMLIIYSVLFICGSKMYEKLNCKKVDKKSDYEKDQEAYVKNLINEDGTINNLSNS
jgi:hypothetical protein